MTGSANHRFWFINWVIGNRLSSVLASVIGLSLDTKRGIPGAFIPDSGWRRMFVLVVGYIPNIQKSYNLNLFVWYVGWAQ